jgi:hypothetical protein
MLLALTSWCQVIFSSQGAGARPAVSDPHSAVSAGSAAAKFDNDEGLRLPAVALLKAAENWKTGSSGGRPTGNEPDAVGDVSRHPQPESEIYEDNNDNINDEEMPKRKWGSVSLQAWGKRKWGPTNSMAVWGKRQAAADSFDGQPEEVAAQDKRKWKDLAAWGKRLAAVEAASKRKWGANNEMPAWGKKRSTADVDNEGLGENSERLRRSIDDEEEEVESAPLRKRQWRRTNGKYSGPKRTWDMNTMKSWGKRRVELGSIDGRPVWFSVDSSDRDDDGGSDQLRRREGRAWSSDNSLRIWGKRSGIVDNDDVGRVW